MSELADILEAIQSVSHNGKIRSLSPVEANRVGRAIEKAREGNRDDILDNGSGRREVTGPITGPGTITCSSCAGSGRATPSPALEGREDEGTYRRDPDGCYVCGVDEYAARARGRAEAGLSPSPALPKTDAERKVEVDRDDLEMLLMDDGTMPGAADAFDRIRAALEQEKGEG